MKILFLSLSGIGNFLMHTPVFRVVKKAHPDWHVTAWVAPRGTKFLAQHNSNVDEVLEIPIKHTLAGHLQTAWKLRSGRYDVGIVLSPGQLIKSAAYLFLAGIPKRIGHTYPLSGRDSRFFLTDSIREDPNLHDIDQNLKLLEFIATSVPAKTTYSLTPPLSKQKKAEDMLDSLNLGNKKLVGFHPGSAPNLRAKRWPLKNWSELGRQLMSKNYHILIFGGPDERKLKEKLKRLIGPGEVSTIDADLLTTAALMQKCEFVVSNDSGLMHLASAGGARTFGLFGPTSEIQTGPRGQNSRAIRAPGTKPAYDTEKNFNLGSNPHETIATLSVDQVFAEISR